MNPKCSQKKTKHTLWENNNNNKKAEDLNVQFILFKV